MISRYFKGVWRWFPAFVHQDVAPRRYPFFFWLSFVCLLLNGFQSLRRCNSYPCRILQQEKVKDRNDRSPRGQWVGNVENSCVFFHPKKTYVWSWGGPFISELEMCFHITSKGSWECPKCICFMSSPKLKEDRYPGDTEKPSLFFNHIFFHWVSSYEKKRCIHKSPFAPFQASHACSGVRGIQAHFRSVRNEKNERSLWVDL